MSKKDYDINYQKEKIKRIYFNLNKETDADIIAFLEAQPNTQGYIKSLIRKELNFMDFEELEHLFERDFGEYILNEKHEKRKELKRICHSSDEIRQKYLEWLNHEHEMYLIDKDAEY